MAETPDAPKKKGSALKKVLVAIVAVVAVFLVVVAMQPKEFEVQRTVGIAASASAIFPFVNDFRQWGQWSPWETVDPAMKRTYEGPASGVGSSYGWTGNAEVGEGRMTIVESTAAERIRIKLEFFKPFPGLSDVQFHFKPEGAGTNVRWVMTGEKNFISKAMCLFMSMDKMVGGAYEKGLANLKAAAESKK